LHILYIQCVLKSHFAVILIEKNHGHTLRTGSQFLRKHGDRNGQEVIEEKNESPEERDQVPQGEDRKAGEQAQEAEEKAEENEMIKEKAPVFTGAFYFTIVFQLRSNYCCWV